jgi:hypothetical protein
MREGWRIMTFVVVRILGGFQWKNLILDHFLCCGLSPSFSTNLSDCYSTLWPESFSRHSSLCIFSSCAVSLASSLRARRRFQTLSSLLLAAQWAARSVFCSSRSVRESSQFSFSFPSRFVCQVPWKNLSRLCGWVTPSRRQYRLSVLRPTSAVRIFFLSVVQRLFFALVCLIQFLSQRRQGPSLYPLPCASPPPGSYSAIIVARIDSSALSVPILCEWL